MHGMGRVNWKIEPNFKLRKVISFCLKHNKSSIFLKRIPKNSIGCMLIKSAPNFKYVSFKYPSFQIYK